ncbi:AraC family transcriptional regulator [Thalassotalea sp. M1531]|uniref:AraC family transcriptional regulator n=1 Tax=Thalassotalea algicola TaxID=2716224 RepID=A0A7Y0LEI9_9GAMM|nr:helix-turn-helix domain-containing protein [Thalassotalea algicola]NMP32783.1 AraC family transcriptional regulator [Thalassotalea algicola]
MNSQILFFFSALGAFNGLLLTTYLLFSKPATIQRRLLAMLMLAISLRVTKSIWFYFDPDIGKQFLQLGLSACFLIGPFLYLYIVSQVSTLEKLRFNWKLHLGLLLSLVIGIGILYPYQSNVALWGWVYKVINITWGIYIIVAAIQLFPKAAAWRRENTRWSKEQLLCINVFAGTTIIWLAYFTASYTSYIVGALSFSLILYVSLSLWFISPKSLKLSEQAYGNKKINQEVAVQLEKRLNELMNNEQLYKNANLTLPTLAKKLQVSVPQLSQLLNDNLNKSFALFVNELRIQEAKRLLVENSHMTMELISEASGYNSQSTFYSSFKHFENITPAQYRKRHSAL